MEYSKKYTKDEAIDKADEFLNELRALEEKHSITINSNRGDIYLTYQSSEQGVFWGHVKIGWDGTGTGLRVLETKESDKKANALAKLTEEERKLLGLE